MVDAGVTCGTPMPDCSGVEVNELSAYGRLYQQVFKPTCANNEGDCHQSKESNGALAGGLFFQDQMDAYHVLMGSDRLYVVPGEPSCSRLAFRISTPDAQRRMPSIGTLSEAEICAILQWIDDGASP